MTEKPWLENTDDQRLCLSRCHDPGAEPLNDTLSVAC